MITKKEMKVKESSQCSLKDNKQFELLRAVKEFNYLIKRVDLIKLYTSIDLFYISR